MRNIILSTAALLVLAACNTSKEPSQSAYYNRGPESLLDVSSEVVNLSVATPADITALKNWIAQDAPSRAELYCPDADGRCADARRVLGSQGVSVMNVPSGDYSVALVYERILARDCKQKFIDNASANSYNAPMPSLGCSVSANMVQHVSDKQQFVNPSIMDTPRATGAVSAYHGAYAPPTTGQQGVTQSIVESARSD